MIIVMIGWVFFSSTDLSAALEYLKVLFCMGGARTFCQHLYALFAENEFDSACYRMPDVYAGADEAVQYFVQKECSDRYYNDFVSTGFGYSLSDFQQLQPIPVLLDSKERRNYK